MDRNIATLLLRLGFGGMMLWHGIPKLWKLLEGDYSFADPFGFGAVPSLVLTVFAEVICASLVCIGWKVKWVSIPLIITMAVAAFVIHGADPFAEKEKALLYLVGYIAIFFLGSGRYSLDGINRTR